VVTAVMAVVVTGAIIVLVATIFVGVTVITALGAAAVGEELPKERTKVPASQSRVDQYVWFSCRSLLEILN